MCVWTATYEHVGEIDDNEVCPASAARLDENREDTLSASLYLFS